jgi:hypothetical protein
VYRTKGGKVESGSYLRAMISMRESPSLLTIDSVASVSDPFTAHPVELTRGNTNPLNVHRAPFNPPSLRATFLCHGPRDAHALQVRCHASSCGLRCCPCFLYPPRVSCFSLNFAILADFFVETLALFKLPAVTPNLPYVTLLLITAPAASRHTCNGCDGY